MTTVKQPLQAIRLLWHNVVVRARLALGTTAMIDCRKGVRSHERRQPEACCIERGVPFCLAISPNGERHIAEGSGSWLSELVTSIQAAMRIKGGERLASTVRMP